MRTTVELPEELLRNAKERAARSRLSLSQFVQLAVRNEIERVECASSDAFELIVRGETGGRAPGPHQVHALLHDEPDDS